ncbi:hypothetical protein OIU79_026311 [Salix purpurea]|uniref:Uncharacterized protein n=1 Tax=Salix purpurea TaxID=77065 RepID=A0A9Q0VTK1_SALPP|nr:hypothetical protein OIU79_026311 [Salix purpurea]
MINARNGIQCKIQKSLLSLKSSHSLLGIFGGNFLEVQRGALKRALLMMPVASM